MGAAGSIDSNRLAKYTYGRNRNQKVLPSLAVETIYGKLLLIGAAVDGKIADKERQWILNSRAAYGVPKSVISSLEKFNPTKEQADEFIANEKYLLKHMKRALVYDCCEMAASDGNFTSKERKVVDEFAKRIDVDETISDQIQKLFDEENEAKKRRVSLLFPGGVDTTIQVISDEKAKTITRAS